MELLKVTANHFKLCEDNFTISYVPVGNKPACDKEFELHEIDEDLFVFNTIGIVGKNASGKTTVVDLLALVYDILSSFRIITTARLFNDLFNFTNIDITFYNDGYLYRYITDLILDSNSINKNILFQNEKLYSRKYYKTYASNLFDYNKYDEIEIKKSLPDDTSILYDILKKNTLRGIYASSDDAVYKDYASAFNIYKMLNNNYKIIELILKMFDEHLKTIEMINDDKFIIYYTNKENIEVNSKELYSMISSGTTKGFGLFTFVVYSLKTGCDLVIDEIENHFHKTLVNNLINLYKDKTVNRNNATLIFTTHYPEVLDLFNRSDNIYITKYNKKIILETIYNNYDIRPELLKSKKFYSNAFGTDVDYDALMNFKEVLMK